MLAGAKGSPGFQGSKTAPSSAVYGSQSGVTASFSPYGERAYNTASSFSDQSSSCKGIAFPPCRGRRQSRGTGHGRGLFGARLPGWRGRAARPGYRPTLTSPPRFAKMLSSI